MNIKKSLRLQRRSLLRGAGVFVGLPMLECMADVKKNESSTPKRLCYIYVPNGVGLPGADSEYSDWNWFPHSQGENYQTTNVLKSLDPFRKDMTILGGLSHPKSRQLMGHIAGDTWLTAGDLRNDYNNSISADQVAANALKSQTRYPYLSLSADGGVGYKSRASTLSYDTRGEAIPSEYNHRQIFERYFSPNGGIPTADRRRSIQRGQKLVDLLIDDSKRLQRRLGHNDKLRIDDHLSSLSVLEEQIKRNESWLNIPLKAFSSDHINFDIDAKIDPTAYIRSMFDLIVLAYTIDLTRVASFMVSREDGLGLGNAYPKLVLGIKKGHHKISHDKADGHWLEWGKYDQWLASNFAYFLRQMDQTNDEFGSLLDNSQILYGSACSTTHNARNYPLILAGGRNLGLKHGSYRVFDKDIPLANLFVKMLQHTGISINHFGDSDNHFEDFDAIYSA